jgi:uncharacterized protein YceK
MTKSLLPLLLLPLLMSGCSTTITNLTPKQQVRNASGLYPVEAVWDTNERNVRRETIKPYVVVDTEFFPMRPTSLTVNRWEAVVPVPAGQKFVNYRFKFDYQYDAIPIPRANSRLSSSYQLEIVDK